MQNPIMTYLKQDLDPILKRIHMMMILEVDIY